MSRAGGAAPHACVEGAGGRLAVLQVVMVDVDKGPGNGVALPARKGRKTPGVVPAVSLLSTWSKSDEAGGIVLWRGCVVIGLWPDVLLDACLGVVCGGNK